MGKKKTQKVKKESDKFPKMIYVGVMNEGSKDTEYLESSENFDEMSEEIEVVGVYDFVGVYRLKRVTSCEPIVQDPDVI